MTAAPTYKPGDLVTLDEDGETYTVLAISGSGDWLQLEGIVGRWVYVDHIRPADGDGKS